MSRYYVMIKRDGSLEQLSVAFPDLEGAKNYKRIAEDTFKDTTLHVMEEMDE